MRKLPLQWSCNAGSGDGLERPGGAGAGSSRLLPPCLALPLLPACLQGGGGEPAGVHSRHLLRQQLLILRSSPDAQAALAVKELDAAPFGQQRAPVRAATPAAPGRLFHLPTPVSPTFAAQSSAPLFTPLTQPTPHFPLCTALFSKFPACPSALPPTCQHLRSLRGPLLGTRVASAASSPSPSCALHPALPVSSLSQRSNCRLALIYGASYGSATNDRCAGNVPAARNSPLPPCAFNAAPAPAPLPTPHPTHSSTSTQQSSQGFPCLPP